jgi:GTP cyclohydrolase I
MCKTKEEIYAELEKILKTQFPTSSPPQNDLAFANKGIICQGPIKVNSMCPHHLMPVIYHVYIAYIPKEESVLGISKLARIAKTLGKRPVLQEQLASEIADVLCSPSVYDEVNDEYVGVEYKWPTIQSEGSAVLLQGYHTCMSCRGVEEEATTTVCELRGAFLGTEMEHKFYSLIKVKEKNAINY